VDRKGVRDVRRADRLSVVPASARIEGERDRERIRRPGPALRQSGLETRVADRVHLHVWLGETLVYLIADDARKLARRERREDRIVRAPPVRDHHRAARVAAGACASAIRARGGREERETEQRQRRADHDAMRRSEEKR